MSIYITIYYCVPTLYYVISIILNNLAVVPHSCVEKADVRTRKKHSQKFRHIGYNIDPYGQSFFPNCISAWYGLAKDIAEANTLDIFKYKLQN